jgi:hypothetical protein
MDEVRTNIDVLCPCVKVVVACKCNCQLVVGVEGDWARNMGSKDVANEQPEPNSFFCLVGLGNVLSLHGQEYDKVLMFEQLGHDTLTYNADVAGDGMTSLGGHAVGVGVANQVLEVLAPQGQAQGQVCP